MQRLGLHAPGPSPTKPLKALFLAIPSRNFSDDEKKWIKFNLGVFVSRCLFLSVSFSFSLFFFSLWRALRFERENFRYKFRCA